MIVDVHAHLNFDEYKDDLDEVIEANRKAGVVAIVNNGSDVASNRRVLEMAAKYDIIKPSLGVYPVHVAEMSEEELDREFDFIREQIKSRKEQDKKDKDNKGADCRIFAIGEVGLDYKFGDDNPHGDKHKEKQRRGFQKFIRLAEETGLPIIVHSRKAELDCIELLEASKIAKHKIVMHCFMGRKHLVKRIIANGWMLSIPCIVNRLQQLRENVEMAPINQLLTETDAPYLTPHKDVLRNEPRFIEEGLKEIAKIKGLTVEETEKLIYQNYQKVFL
ncbi:TatD family hydrolase [Candidatus Woesearchaeota archaeon]|nr:TatD family hydrolase [Candidatus Woesearchaeota archaeon]